jgi:DNA helicase-2/ATP-dependent DNA helicase PcrA
VDTELHAGTPPDRIGYFSFTRRAAEEAVTRASTKFNLTPRQLPHFRTLHSLAFRALGLSSKDVFEGRKVWAFADWARIRVSGKTSSEDGTLAGFEIGDRILFLENLARIRCVPLRQQYDEWGDDGLDWNEVCRVLNALKAFKTRHALLDFTDMIAEFLRSNLTVDLDSLIVDETQDLSPLQWRMVRHLASTVKSFAVAGDDDQAVYRWAGADVDTFVNLPGDSQVLGQSYRVPAAVQALADSVITPVHRRRPKKWAPRAAAGGVSNAEHLGDVDLGGKWAGDVQPTLILARNTYILREQVEPELRRMGVLYEWRDRPSLNRATVETVVAWEHLRAGKSVEADRVRSIYALMSPGRGVERAHRELPGVPGDHDLTLGELTQKHGLLTQAIWHEALDKLPPEDVAYIVAARQRGEHLLGRARVRLSTIHAAKGGEAEHVVLFREMARRTYDEMESEGGDDERRVWYVAVTRARERLTVVEGTRAEVCPWV